MSGSVEELASPGLAAIKQERAARKAADREVAELRAELATVGAVDREVQRLRDELRIMRDRAELWEYRAIRYSNERNQYKDALTRISKMS